MFSVTKGHLVQTSRGPGQMVEIPKVVRAQIVRKSGADLLKGGQRVRIIFSDSSKEGRRVLIYLPSGEVIASYSDLESKLYSHGWERCCDDPDLQFRKRSTVDLVISLPKDFGNFTSIHMDDIVLKNHNVFEVREM